MVFAATDRRDQSEWALKRILKKDFQRDKLERELAIMAGLDHPRILHLRQAFEAGKTRPQGGWFDTRK